MSELSFILGLTILLIALDVSFWVILGIFLIAWAVATWD